MGTFAFNKKENNLYVKVEGVMTQKEAADYIVAYKKNVASMPTKNAIILDSTKLQVSTKELVGMLEGCFVMYKEDFKECKVILKKGENAILRMQITRLARNVNLNMLLEEI